MVSTPVYASGCNPNMGLGHPIISYPIQDPTNAEMFQETVEEGGAQHASCLGAAEFIFTVEL